MPRRKGVMCWGICMTWRKLYCLKPNLQEAQCARPPEKRLKTGASPLRPGKHGDYPQTS
jgi:hypothetical protein